MLSGRSPHLRRTLRQVVAEGRENHRVQTVRRVWIAGSRPGNAVNIGELGTPLDAAPVHFLLRPVIRLQPETECALVHYTSIGRAARKGAGNEAAGVEW